jgi:sigma54-dependent transcription regulator
MYNFDLYLHDVQQSDYIIYLFTGEHVQQINQICSFCISFLNVDSAQAYYLA